MENKKDIGKAFKDKLEQLEKTPSDRLWNAIEKDLDAKKKKRRPVFWLFPMVLLSGLLLGGLWYTFYQSENTDNSNAKNNQESTVNAKTIVDKNGKTIDTENTSDTKNKNISHQNKNAVNQNKNIVGSDSKTNENQLIVQPNQEKIIKNVIVKNGSESTAIASNSKTNKNNAGNKNNGETKPNIKSKSAINTTYSKTTNSTTSTRLIKKTRKLIKSTEEYDEYEVVQKYTYVVKKKKHSISIPNKKIGHAKPKRKNNNPKKSLISKLKDKQDLTKDALITDKNETRLGKKAENNPEIQTKTDSTIVPVVEIQPKIVPKKEIKKTISKDSTIVEKEKKHLYFSPYLAPTHYSSIGKGNSVSDQYKNDTKKSITTYSYGCYVRWMFNDKIGTRTGVAKTNLAYTTQIQKSNTNFIDTRNISLAPNLTTTGINAQFANDAEVVLTQKISYIEVPLEVYYIFSDKKFGLASAIGLSLLYLNENELTLKSNSINEYKIGNATNLSEQCFTANARLNLNFRLSKSFRLDLSPSFQYQIMGFKNASDFKPYILSLQAGVSYHF